MSEKINHGIVLNVLESMLISGLRTVRAAKKEAGVAPLRSRSPRKKSNIKLVEDILEAAGKPLHVDEIIIRAKSNFNVALNRESIVSSLTKKVLDGKIFRRTGPNEFSLINKEGR